MLNITRHDPDSIGAVLARKLKRGQLRRGRRRPRTKRPAERKPQPTLYPLEAALRATPGGESVLEALEQERELHAALALGEYALSLAEGSLHNLRECQAQACDARDRASSAAERLEHHREVERLEAQIRNAEAGVGDARVLLADTRQQLEGAEAGVDMAVRGLMG